jgi:NADH-quinone oxidoreductase subunit E
MFNLKPTGKCLIEVCHTSSCWLRGAEDIIKHIENKLNIKPGETTADGKFSLKRVECLGSCGTAPMFQVGSQFYENLTNDKVDIIIDNLSKIEKRPTYFDMVDLINQK